MSANLALLLWKAAETRPGHAAVVERARETSFLELKVVAAAVLDLLRDRGAKPGDRAALLYDRSATAIGALAGIHAAGLVAVVINDRLRSRQMEHQLDHSGARFLLTAPAMLERLSRSLNTRAETLDISGLRPGGKSDPVPRADHDPAQIIYTSGSSGLPKGVVFAHGALQTGIATVNGYLGQRPDDRIASLLALSTVYGLNQVFTAIDRTATIVVETSPLATEVVAALRAREVTVLAAVPPLWLQLLAVKDFNAAGLPSLRLLQNAGGHLPVEAVRRVREAFPGADLYLQYGQTETFRGTFLPPGEVDRRPGSMGRPVPGADVRVLRDDGTAAAPDEIGELVHAGPTIASGYWNNPEATARVFRPHPDPALAASGARAVFSGDLVRRDAEGFLSFVSRNDRLIKTMGFRVGPDEVGDVLHASGEVSELVVTSEPDKDRGERIVVYVVLRAGGDLTRLTRYARAELPPYMVPARYEPVARLPRLPSGKYDLKSLLQPETPAPGS